MKKIEAEPYRDIDFSLGKRGPVIQSEPGKTKIPFASTTECSSIFERWSIRRAEGTIRP